ncbi:hypothetical protein F7725_014750, partial [Dissostichus mawsoni]
MNLYVLKLYCENLLSVSPVTSWCSIAATTTTCFFICCKLNELFSIYCVSSSTSHDCMKKRLHRPVHDLI